MDYKKRQILRIILFLIIVEIFTIGLIIIVPKGKILLIAIAICILIISVRSLWRMSVSNISFIDYETNQLLYPFKKQIIKIPLVEITRNHWVFKYIRQDKKVSFFDLVKMINAGLFLRFGNKYLPMNSKIDKNDYDYLINNHNAPIAALNHKKKTALVYIGDNNIEINENTIKVIGSIGTLEFETEKIKTGIFMKKWNKSLVLNKWGGSFKYKNMEITYDYIRPFEFI